MDCPATTEVVKGKYPETVHCWKSLNHEGKHVGFSVMFNRDVSW